MRPQSASILNFDRIHPDGFRAAIAACALLAASACSDGEAGDAAPAGDREQSASETETDETEPVGSLSIDGESYELVKAFWCEPGPLGDGTELVIKIGAFHEDNRLINVQATQVDRDRDRPSVQSVLVNVPGTESDHRSGDVELDDDTDPVLVVEGGQARIEGEVVDGGEMMPIEAQFVLPDEPGGLLEGC